MHSASLILTLVIIGIAAAALVKGRGKPWRWYLSTPAMAYRLVAHRLRLFAPRFMPPIAAIQRRFGLRAWIVPFVLSRTAEEYEARVYVHTMVRDYLRKYKAELPEESKEIPRRIWVYWAQGAETMPEVVKACVERLRFTQSTCDIVLLDDRTIQDYVAIPDCVYTKIFRNKTQFSDILRVSLLCRYGGIWIDATCFCRSDLHPMISATEEGSGFFAFRRNERDRYMLSSWFMISRPNNIIPVMLRDVMLKYWSSDRALNDPIFPNWNEVSYFFIHFVFEALYNLDSGFRNCWDASVDLNAYDPHRIQSKLLDKFDEAEWNRIINLTPVHKLTYKLPQSRPDIKNTYFERILSWKDSVDMRGVAKARENDVPERESVPDA